MIGAAFRSLAVILTMGSAVALAAPDPFIGTWVLDRSQSSRESGTLPERMIIVMTATGSGVHYRSETAYADGRIAVSEYTADYDGTLAAVSSATGLLAPVSLKRLADHTVEASYMRGMRVIATARRTTTEDGKLMTITTLSKDEHQNEQTRVAVFRHVQ